MRSRHTRLLSFIIIIKEKDKHKVASLFWRDQLFHNVLPFTVTFLYVYVR